jgi:hypothetical protein
VERYKSLAILNGLELPVNSILAETGWQILLCADA